MQGAIEPLQPVLFQVDPILQSPIFLSDDEFRQIVAFVRDSLHNKKATPRKLRKLIPAQVPRG